MASGKSLELAKIAPHPSAKCTCGEPYDEHLRKDGKGLLKKFDDGTHRPMASFYNRRMRRHATH